MADEAGSSDPVILRANRDGASEVLGGGSRIALRPPHSPGPVTRRSPFVVRTYTCHVYIA